MRRIFIALTIILFTSSTFAQEFDLGVKVGFNSTKLATTNVGSLSGYTTGDLMSEASNGYNVGAFARIGLGKFYLQPELLYTMKKGQTTFDIAEAIDGQDPVNGITQNIDIKSIDIPILLGFKILDFKLASLRAFTGPSLSIILDNSTIEVGKTGVSLNQDFKDNFTDVKNLKDNAWDWQLGGAIDVAMFTVDARYSWGLTNLFEGKATDIGFESKGNYLTVSLGFRFL
jgi:hypothetical protein